MKGNLSQDISNLIDSKVFKPDYSIRWGEVISVDPTLVRLSGDSGDVPVDHYLSSYTPTTNDRVVLLKVGTAWVILGDII